jgi:uncharacterized protein YndB with AHSA1/START domain
MATTKKAAKKPAAKKPAAAKKKPAAAKKKPAPAKKKPASAKKPAPAKKKPAPAKKKPTPVKKAAAKKPAPAKKKPAPAKKKPAPAKKPAPVKKAAAAKKPAPAKKPLKKAPMKAAPVKKAPKPPEVERGDEIVEEIGAAPEEAIDARTTTIVQNVELPAPPDAVYRAYLDAGTHARFTQEKAEIDPRPGGKLSAYAGYISGEILMLEEGRRIVHSWRTTEWPAGLGDSRVELTLEPSGTGTTLTMVHSDVPASQAASYEAGWRAHYWDVLETFFRPTPDAAITTPSPVDGVAAVSPFADDLLEDAADEDEGEDEVDGGDDDDADDVDGDDDVLTIQDEDLVSEAASPPPIPSTSNGEVHEEPGEEAARSEEE